MSARVFRVDAPEGPATEYPSLVLALSEPPVSPESEIRGSGGLLAESDQEFVAWVLTAAGTALLERERGEVAA